MDGKGTKRKVDADAVGNGYQIRHSTEHPISLEHYGSPWTGLVSAGGSASAQQPARLAEQRQLETGVLNLLTNYQLTNMDATDNGFLACRATYTFQMDLQNLKSAALNDFGQGKLQRVRVSGIGNEISPCQRGWRTALDCKCSVATSRQLFSDDELEHGFEVPWRASIQLEQVPDNCILTEVQLAFINPYECPTVHVEMKATNTQSIGFINNTLKNIDGQTYSKCCQELGIFREAYCFITMRVPLRSFLRKLLTAFRRTIPLCPAPDEVITVTEGADNVVLTRQGKIEIDRQALAGISSAARAMFAVGAAGKASSYDLDYSKAAVLAVLSAALLKQESLPGDPRRAAPFFLYEVMKLALSWDIPQLKLWTQVAFVERLCHPVANLEQIPVLDAVRIIHDHADGKEVGGRMVLCGLICVLRILHSPTAHWTLDELQQIIEPKSALWKSVIQPTRWVPDASVFVKTLTGKTLTVPVNLAYFVYQLKCRIQDMEGLPMDQQRLIFANKQLVNDVTLSDCGITTQATLLLIVRMRGC